MVSPEWSSSHRNKIKSEIDNPHNTVTVTNPDTGETHQKVTMIPVHSDEDERPFAVYEIDADAVSYNFDNGRLWKYKRFRCRKLGIDPDVGLNPENVEHQKIIQDILLNTKAYSNVKPADLKKDMARRGQQIPAYITPEGVMWNGNRRCAVIREFYENGYSSSGITIQPRSGKWSRIKVAILPDGMTSSQLRDLEKRLSEEPKTEEDYGRVNEMGGVHDYIRDYKFANGDYATATKDEKKDIVNEYKKTEWSTWNKIAKAKRTIDLMDEYLESRDTDANPLIGNYDVIENNEGGVTWFENLVALLDAIEEKYEGDIDADTKYDKWKYSQFSAYETGKVEQGKIRALTNVVKNATGNQDPTDTTSLLATHVNNDPVISHWTAITKDPSSIINNPQVAAAVAANISTTSRTYEQLGNSPKVVIQGILSDLINNINSNQINSNDKDLVDLIEKCEKKLAVYKAKAKA